ncbi:dihydroxyacid dehydratase [Rhizobiales bacterium GAS191]|nr:dihydroxyacid dehydratase [Rhizobiales bacterium GAS113]SEC01815.1 dihydroxyacid dehydratase [Rhizobiales bacterium GAS191]SED17204.1 dihydroxyacid dehydratase [Rhizobiales bacterium GAS188]
MTRPIESLRSQRWFAADDFRAFGHRQRAQQMGLRREEFMGRPVVAILNTWSDLSPCHAHLRERGEAVKRGVLQAGGFPFELPAMSLGEVLVKPTTMIYRNFLAMEAEELLRSLPVDGAVLLGGCDKTTPGLVMGALSMDIPAIFVPAGPMLNDHYKGNRVGAGTHSRKYWDEYQAGNIDKAEWTRLEQRMTRAPGTCNTMGTASTMTNIVEAMGLSFPGAAAIPAMDSGNARMASASGARMVEMIREDLKPSIIVTKAAVMNGVAAYLALGGSTNAAIHLIAMAGRAGIALTLDELDAMARKVPVLVNLFPSGDKLMEDFYYAGGLPALLKKIEGHLHLGAMTVTGKTLAENIADARCEDDEVIRDPSNPVSTKGALAVLHGNLAPSGAVVKPSAFGAQFFTHCGPALVFDSNAEMHAAMRDPNIDADENTVLVLRNAGPIGAPGMPEWGNLPIPQKLLKRGVRDMVRISDARMSGTHFGACVLHVAPEAAIGGPLALVQNGDMIELDIEARKLHLDVSREELARRKAAWKPRDRIYERGYVRLYQQHVSQADKGCDLDFLEGSAKTPEPVIY